MLILSFVLLMAVFRSLLVPVKAVILNLLSIGAAYGGLVAIFQWGWGKGLIGVDRTGPIEPWIPMMMFAIVFGLSMDYEVFLLSRMKEHYDKSRNNALAVADGLAATARVITAAALIMVCVFLSFVIGDDRSLKMFGLGLAIAVAVDATIVRMLLVPVDDGTARRPQLVDPEVDRSPAPAHRRRRPPRRGLHRRRRRRPESRSAPATDPRRPRPRGARHRIVATRSHVVTRRRLAPEHSPRARCRTRRASQVGDPERSERGARRANAASPTSGEWSPLTPAAGFLTVVSGSNGRTTHTRGDQP